jgi:hypothetical protein
MVSVQISISRGANGFQLSDFTIGTSAPGAGDIELRYNVLDTNSATITRKDIMIALEAFERLVESPVQSPAGTWIPLTPVL